MKQMDEIKKQMKEVLENNILSFWLDKMVDNENRGFYGQMTGEGKLVPEANKGGILNARMLWTFSAAYRVLHKPEYLVAATRVKDYILEHFYDKTYGGTYWEVDCKGNPVDTKKQFYAIGFMIYGLSEYTRATGDEEALNYAIKLFRVIEKYSFDAVNNGYIEACTREWGEMADMRLSDKDENEKKSQNTHLHIIEPYANLYRVWKDAALEKALRNLIMLFTDKILNKQTYHLDLFFDDEWHSKYNLESYGHDIEASWLIHEAALVLGDKAVLAKVEPIIRQIAVASEKGLQPDGSMIYEANLDTGYVCTDRHWWVQAETVVGNLNLYQHFGDEAALQKATRCWNYIQTHLIDYEGGEWWWSCDAEGHINRKDDKAGFWKCPYHNSRLCLEVLERFK